MNYKYGHFSEEQVEEYKNKLHKELFWLLLYKDPEKNEIYHGMDFNKYFKFLMKQLNGLNELFFRPPSLVKLNALLEAALIETKKDEFDFQTYRKLVLDSHKLVDEPWEVVSE